MKQLFLFLALSITATAFAQNAPIINASSVDQSKSKLSIVDERAFYITDSMVKQFEIMPDAKPRLLLLNITTCKQLDELHRQSKPMDEDSKKLLQQKEAVINADYEFKLKEVLNPEQWEVYLKLKAEKEKKKTEVKK